MGAPVQTGGQRAASVEVDGKSVALTPEGVAKARAEGLEVGRTLAEQVRREVAE